MQLPVAIRHDYIKVKVLWYLKIVIDSEMSHEPDLVFYPWPC